MVAWNFFEDFGPADSVGSHAPYEPQHIGQLCGNCRPSTSTIWWCIPWKTRANKTRQEQLAITWQTQGLVGHLGTWMPELGADAGPYSFAVAPCNVATDSAERFAAYKAKGWETFGTSPFVRGWELDKRAAGKDRAAVADQMLRYAAFANNVDRLIVAMRRVEWVGVNLASVSRGPLS